MLRLSKDEGQFEMIDAEAWSGLILNRSESMQKYQIEKI